MEISYMLQNVTLKSLVLKCLILLNELIDEQILLTFPNEVTIFTDSNRIGNKTIIIEMFWKNSYTKYQFK